jgi:hypothetical protein
MLHDPARHEALAATSWSEARAREAIERIVRDAEARFTPERWWPAHPRDDVPPEVAAQPATPLYMGGAGMVWALRTCAMPAPRRCSVTRSTPTPTS